MASRLVFKYDRDSDTLYIDKCPPYPEQESEEIGDDIVARINPRNRQVENLEVLFFSTRLFRKEIFEIPVEANLLLQLQDAT